MEREKVLNAMRCHAGCERGFDCGDCAYIGNGDCLELLAMDAYALLKEQEERIGVLERTIAQMPNPVKLLDVFGSGYAKVVRCKDCRKNMMCQLTIDKPKDWFCADGRRKIDNE